MKIVLSSIGKFHHFDLARQLLGAGYLDVLYTGYPQWKLAGERLPVDKVLTTSIWQTVYMAHIRYPLGGLALRRRLESLALAAHDNYVAKVLKPCDVFVGLSGHNGRAGRRAKDLGAIWVCDRGSSHIEYQDAILREESLRWSMPVLGVSPGAIEREMREYAQADTITIPSRFVEKTFLDAGVSAAKLQRIPYGVELGAFHPVAEPAPDRFDVIFVGQVTLRKGIPYLIEAFRRFKHPRKSLTVIGTIDPAFAPWLRMVRDPDITFRGHVAQAKLKDYLSRSHVFILPSIEEGMALVQAQALACGCPVICTPNTGGEDILEHGRSGFVVPIRDAAAITERLEQLAGDKSLSQAMRHEAVKSVRAIGGWNTYGEKWIDFLDGKITQAV